MTQPSVHSPIPAPEARCVVCDQPIIDHIPFRYWWKAYWRHRVIPIVGFILGHLPLAILADKPDW